MILMSLDSLLSSITQLGLLSGLYRPLHTCISDTNSFEKITFGTNTTVTRCRG